MTTPSHRALQVLLMIFSVLLAVGGLLAIFAGKPLVLRALLHPPEAEVSTLLLASIKEIGGFLLMLSLMIFFAARDPVRNVAIIDATIVGACVLALTPLVTLYTLDITRLYPAWMIWTRALVRLALAAVLYWLRPRESAASSS